MARRLTYFWNAPFRGDIQKPPKSVSPNAWQNANLNGRYEFLKKVAPLNLDIIIRDLTELPIGAMALAA
jgi:hypothetical protein